ncbi:MAG: nitrous oxide-stimulated promoter family protein [Halarcobacter sp.]
MEIKKFNEEITTLKKFFEFYCDRKHTNQINTKLTLIYKDTNISLNLKLCKECLEKINYSFQRLQECSHEIKPKCRKCPTPCYEKKQWKETAKIMRYSGINLKFLSLKDLLG